MGWTKPNIAAAQQEGDPVLASKSGLVGELEHFQMIRMINPGSCVFINQFLFKSRLNRLCNVTQDDMFGVGALEINQIYMISNFS